MKNILNICITAFVVFAFISSSHAQNSQKEMDKKTKSTLKAFKKDPESYRTMIKRYKKQISDYENQVAELEEDFYKADYLSRQYNDSLQKMQAKQAGADSNNGLNNAMGTGGMFPAEGTDYRVQLGAYRYFDFTQLLELNQPIGFEKVDEVIHYYMGSWSSANDADEFAQAIRKLKIKDAFVTKYVDGSRMPYDHILEGSGTAFNQE
ncbi:MAG: hypothetical protein QNK51_04245 [Chitinophagales bacterium]|tara:strand:+ start:147 stop:767 length:621 start_codon:yes stop_codon:yes gene_type:complete